MTKLTAIYAISIVLLLVNPIDRSLKHYDFGASDSLLPKLQKSLIGSFKERKLARLVVAYTIGEKRYLSKSIKRSHSNLNLLHLFTPSGIHLSSLYLLLTPLLMQIKRRSTKGYFIAISVLCLSMFLLPKFYSVKRVTLLRQLTLMLGRFKSVFTPLNLFFLTFGLDFLVGTYNSSPLSYCYSFLFLGVIICNIETVGPKLIFSLLGAQIIVGAFQVSSMTMVGFLFGFVLTGLFSTIFPVIFILFWMHPLIGTSILEAIITSFNCVVTLCSKAAESSGHYTPSLLLVGLVLIFSLRIDAALKAVILVIATLIHSDPIFNLPINDGLKTGASTARNEKVSSVKRTRRGYKVHFIDGVVCTAKLYNGFYKESCR